MKKIFVCFFCVLFAVLSSGCGSSKNEAQGERKLIIRAAHSTNTEYPYHIGMEVLAKSMAAKTQDKVEVRIFPNGQMGGNEREVVDMLKTGPVNITVVNSATLGILTPKIDAFNLPFMFRDLQHLYAALDGEPGTIVAKDLEEKGFKVLSWWINPGRNIYNAKGTINTLADLNGMKIRTTQSDVAVATFTALGAVAKPMAYGEVYAALQQGIVDGSDDVVGGYLGMKFYEVAPYYSLTNHFYVACPLLMDLKYFNELPLDIQKMLLEAAADGSKAMRSYTEEQINQGLRALNEKGAKINKVENIEPFKKAVEPVYRQFEDKIGKDLVEKTRNVR